MNVSRIVLTATLLLPFTAKAQAGLYGTFTATRMGGIPSSPYAVSAANGGTRSTIDVSGGTFGGYYDFKTVGPMRLGADVRGVISADSRGGAVNFVTAGSHLYSALGGVRGSFHTPVKWIQPYVQLSAGLGRSDYGLARRADGSRLLLNNFEYHAYAGADLRLAPFLDFRAVELGYGGLAGGGQIYGLRSVSSGVVFHLPTLQ